MCRSAQTLSMSSADDFRRIFTYNTKVLRSFLDALEHDYETYHSMSQVQEFMSKVLGGVDGFMKELNDDDLSRKITAPWMEGEHELSDVFMQVTLEQAHHLGEIIALLWQLNIEPPEMTRIDNK